MLALLALLYLATPDGSVVTPDAGTARQGGLLMIDPGKGLGLGGTPIRTLTKPGDQIHGHAAEVERARLAELGPLATCSDRACLEAALTRCTPARLDVYEQRGGCAMEAPRLPLHAWYAVAKRKRGRCEVLMFGARGAQVVADRWCRGVPLQHYDLACPDDPDVKRMVAASRPAARRERR